MKKKIVFLVFAILVFYGAAFSQMSDSLLISQLIDNLSQTQVKEDGNDFYKGMFPSFRECGGSPHNYQPDNNIFYTAVSVLAVKNLRSSLSQQDQAKVDSMVARATSFYHLYRNKNNYPFYSFWAKKDVIMPHTFVFQYLKTVFGQSEDADDSVMALLGMNNDENDNLQLKKRLIETSNLSQKKIISTFKKYRLIPAYSTWLGYRMPVDFDFGVHCNILYFMKEKQLPFLRQDSATIVLLQQMIANRDYMKYPVYISPYYVKSSVLLYHIARLLGRFSIPELDVYKPQMIADIQSLLKKSNNVLEQIILRTSLMRLGGHAAPIPALTMEEFENSNQKQFVFFQARAAFSYPTPLKQIFLHWSYIYYFFYCPAYSKILWLEYLIEEQKFKQKK